MAREAISSILSPEMRVQGEIEFQGKARIDGRVKGNIRGEYLILSESARVTGDLHLDTLICHGRVEGDIEASTVTAHSSAVIQGRVQASSLTVEPGASLEGEISASKPKQKTNTATKQQSGPAKP